MRSRLHAYYAGGGDDGGVEVFGDDDGEQVRESALTKRPYFPTPPDHILKRLSRLSGRCFLVYLVVFRETRCEGSESVRLTNTRLSKLGVDRDAKRRALATLERAGLVAVLRRDRRSPEVTILDPEGRDS
jgi:hypothetical protein